VSLFDHFENEFQLFPRSDIHRVEFSPKLFSPDRKEQSGHVTSQYYRELNKEASKDSQGKKGGGRRKGSLKIIASID
jgi:hypothetical protein